MHNRDREDLFGKQDKSQPEREETRRPDVQFEGSTGSISGEEDMERTGYEEVEVEEDRRLDLLLVVVYGMPHDEYAHACRHRPSRKRTRTSQKAMIANGAKASTNSTGEPRTTCGMTSCWPRKKEPVAMKNATHIRHR